MGQDPCKGQTPPEVCVWEGCEDECLQTGESNQDSMSLNHVLWSGDAQSSAWVDRGATAVYKVHVLCKFNEWSKCVTQFG